MSDNFIYLDDYVSIIMPAYNAQEFISDSIKSVLSQSYTKWELIIVNDCSTDNTEGVISSFLNKDKRIIYFPQEKNGGTAKARNKGISLAKGRYIAFLDSDDLWASDKLEKQLSFMRENNYSFTYTAYYAFDSLDYKKGHVFNAPLKLSYSDYLKNTAIGNLTVIIDRYIIQDFRVREGILEDVLTWMHYLKQGYIAYGLDEVLADYRVYSNSKSGNKIRNARKYFECLRKYEKLSLIYSLYCECCYAFNAIKKRLIR